MSLLLQRGGCIEILKERIHMEVKEVLEKVKAGEIAMVNRNQQLFNVALSYSRRHSRCNLSIHGIRNGNPYRTDNKVGISTAYN